MQRISKLALCAALVAVSLAAPAWADSSGPSTNGGSSWTAPASANMTNRLVFGGVSVDGGGYGGAFAIRAGIAYGFASFGDGWAINGIGEVGTAFCCGGVFFPLEAGAAVSYDKLLVKIYGGLTFTVLPNTIAHADTPVGLDIWTMAAYPLPVVAKGFVAQVGIGIYVLDDEFGAEFHAEAGVGYSF